MGGRRNERRRDGIDRSLFLPFHPGPHSIRLLWGQITERTFKRDHYPESESAAALGRKKKKKEEGGREGGGRLRCSQAVTFTFPWVQL